VKYPGNCQTAPGKSPYFYEEENWADDMELGAAELYALTREQRFLAGCVRLRRERDVTPWMGADTARHYEWYPVDQSRSRRGLAASVTRRQALMAHYYRQGLERVSCATKTNGFRVGHPIHLVLEQSSCRRFATQALIYRRMTGDERFREYEAAALDWLFGANPWGTSMVIGLPWSGTWPHDPHSVLAKQLGVETQLGGLVDGPVYRFDLRQPARHPPLRPGRVRAVQHGLHRLSRRPGGLLDE
jgi:hypothetical protein